MRTNTMLTCSGCVWFVFSYSVSTNHLAGWGGGGGEGDLCFDTLLTSSGCGLCLVTVSIQTIWLGGV